MSRIIIAGDNHLETLRRCGGFYERPTSPGTGEEIGPLVGYAGTYFDEQGKELQYVGKVYANFAMAELHSNVLKFFATGLLIRLSKVINLESIDALVGAPIGGYSLADALGFSLSDAQMVKAEKMVIAPKTETSREKSKLIFNRHGIENGWKCVIVEDVCNNFSTTGELVQLIRARGGEVIAIACFLNRSLKVDDEFICKIDETPGGNRAIGIPVASVVRKPIPEYRQDDPEVARDILAKNVVWKPKNEWHRLASAMQGAS